VLIAKGYRVRFVLFGNRSVRAPAGYALLHDPSGHAWPKCSGLCAPFTKTKETVDDREARSYFGFFSDAPGLGKLVLPPKDLGSWKRVGEVDEILYTRARPNRLRSSHQADYFHPFEGKAVLYRRGRLLRIELGRGCVWNWRGIVRP
jgi:hypothetical protein